MDDIDLVRTNQDLRRRIASLIGKDAGSDGFVQFEPQMSMAVADVVVSHNEINSRHGTGVLIQKLFRGCPEIATIRSVDNYEGEQEFGAKKFRLPKPGMSRCEIFRAVTRWIGSTRIRRVVCVPYAAEDLLAAIVVREISTAPLCVYVMDDQNITAGLIPDDLMREALEKARLRLAISPEMQHAYQNKYRRKFWLLPPLVSHELIRTDAIPSAPRSDGLRGALVGNIWSQKWLDLLCEALGPTGVEVDWYCNSSSPWLKFDRGMLRRCGLNACGGLPEEDLAHRLPSYAFFLAPSGTLDDSDSNLWVARLSLPSRIPFALATAHIPVIVTGSPATAAARFVQRFQVGACSEYNAAELRRAIERVTEVESQKAIRENARRIANMFSDEGSATWLWDAVERGEPSDLRFEQLFSVRPGDFLYYADPPPPDSLWPDFHPVYQAMRRLKQAGYAPDFVFDVGASDGIWSQTVNRIFPNARFILVEALASHYEKAGKPSAARLFPNFELAEIAMSNKTGRMSFQVSSDLYNSSLLRVSDAGTLAETIEVDVTTLDNLAAARNVSGRGMLKVDVQFAEHMVIEGGRDFISNHVDVVVLELTLERAHPEAKTFDEMILMMSELGFRYFDDAGEWRAPASGLLEQKDVLFVRRSLLPSA